MGTGILQKGKSNWLTKDNMKVKIRHLLPPLVVEKQSQVTTKHPVLVRVEGETSSHISQAEMGPGKKSSGY